MKRFIKNLPLLLLAGFIAAFAVTKGTHLKTFGTKKFIFKNYKDAWATVDSLEKKGLQRSALEVVEKIHTRAKADVNQPQWVKCVIYELKLQASFEEDEYIKAIHQLENECKIAPEPARQILHSITAETHWQYYSNNRYRFEGRTFVENLKIEDVRTWDLRRLFDATLSHYHASLSNEKLLISTRINLFDEILVKGENSRKLRPTVYDFLAHRAADYFMNEESGLTQPGNTFVADKQSLLSDSKIFCADEIITSDTASLKYLSALTLQKIEASHLNDTNTEALIDISLKRLQYMRKISVLAKKDSLYLLTLLSMEGQFASNPQTAETVFLIASYYNKLTSPDVTENTNPDKWNLRKAFNKCIACTAKYPKTTGADKCKELMVALQRKSLVFNNDKNMLPGKPFLASVLYKNLSQTYVKVIRLNETWQKERFAEYLSQEKIIDNILSGKLISEYPLTLPMDSDMRDHRVEIKIDALEKGCYALLISDNKNFSTRKNAVAYSVLNVTELSYSARQLSTGENELLVLNRSSGEPMKDVTVNTYKQEYDYKTRKNKFEKSGSYVTSANGSVTISATDKYNNFLIELKTADDYLWSGDYMYNYARYNEETSYIKSFLFTDRAIYRPGQIIYFKGIRMRVTNNKHDLMVNQSVNVKLYDVNYQVVSELKLTTNEYGTYSGTFTAPAGGLTGQMHITDDNNTVYFSVEEYKRPKFEVVYNPINDTYRLNDSVKVYGKAKAFSGAAVSDAGVKYRVVRSARYPYWYWWRGVAPSSPEIEIANGTLSTNDTGGFIIPFVAIPDLTISKDSKPLFNYRVYADVVDINGETHSQETSVSVGYNALLLDASWKEKMNKAESQTSVVQCTNLNGINQQVKIGINIYKLSIPDRIIYPRAWAAPDKFLMSQEEFYMNFPNAEYKKESNVYLWEKESKIYTGVLNTGNSTDFTLPAQQLKDWQSGWYVAELTAQDEWKNEVKQLKYFQVFDGNEAKCPVPTDDWILPAKVKVEPGENAMLYLGTSLKDVKVLYELEQNNERSRAYISEKKWLRLNNELMKIEIPITETQRGNIALHLTFVKDNKFHSHDILIMVPYTNKELDVRFETFRDKLQPGQKEEWKIIIKDKKGQLQAAEMLATMYDASLDAFAPNNWYFDIYTHLYSSLNQRGYTSFTTLTSNIAADNWNEFYYHSRRITYDRLNWFGYNHYYSRMSAAYYDATGGADISLLEGDAYEEQTKAAAPRAMAMKKGKNNADELKEAEVTTATTGEKNTATDKREETINRSASSSQIIPRTNFNETAFFYPHLQTNDKGEIIIQFTLPESLTRWKMMGFTHTKDLKYAHIEKELIAQKSLMAVPNAPRFFREGDKLSFVSKITNLSETDLSGTFELKLFDAVTSTDITSQLLGKSETVVPINIAKGLSTPVTFDLTLPENVSAITYRVTAKAGNFSDAEEMTIPVLTNRMLVTESIPLNIRGNQTKTFTLDKLLNTTSATLSNHKLTLEYTANPAWYTIQSLPYLMEYPYECSEQTFNRFFANSIASHIANSSPKIKAVFDQWKTAQPSALLSNLEKNQELKSLLLKETPWVLDAKNESERKKRVALLFDLNKMANESEHCLNQLLKLQTPNGGFPWFDGMPDDRYITQYIVSGIGHLEKLGITNIRSDKKLNQMLVNAIHYMDKRMEEDYERLLKYYKKDISKMSIGSFEIQYLYARSYFKDIPVANSGKKAFDYYLGQSEKYWLQQSRYLQGMTALVLHRYNKPATSSDILKSLKETAIINDEMGMYWKENYQGYYWFESPVEAQALLIEAFDEIAKDTKTVDDLKTWLLKSKQTQNWKSTIATADACYALLLRGTEWLNTEIKTDITIGDIVIDPYKADAGKPEAGTGYFKTTWSANEIKPQMAKVTVSKKDNGVSWGALYWQYFENLDKITPHETPLKINKQLFLEKTSANGLSLQAITDKNVIKVGDKIKVRIELRSDRTMDYVHLKDMRASGLEPVNVLSRYKYQDGLGYYESTKDASTDFFFSNLPKGTYVFEYTLIASQSGDFSNGISTIQCMYAPEFTSHSEGIRIKINSK